MALNRSNIITDNRNIPYDLYYVGTPTAQGILPEIYGKDALDNAITLWAVSQKGEQGRRPNRGGYLYQYLSTPLGDDTARAMEQSIMDGLSIDFLDDLTVNFLQVTANYDRSRWEVQLQVFSERLKLFTNTEIFLNGV